MIPSSSTPDPTKCDYKSGTVLEIQATRPAFAVRVAPPRSAFIPLQVAQPSIAQLTCPVMADFVEKLDQTLDQVALMIEQRAVAHFAMGPRAFSGGKTQERAGAFARPGCLPALAENADR
jgi:hypothetical protein